MNEWSSVFSIFYNSSKINWQLRVLPGTSNKADLALTEVWTNKERWLFLSHFWPLLKQVSFRSKLFLRPKPSHRNQDKLD